MKILYYFKELDTPMYQWQRFHIFDELKQHNCEIEVFNPLKYSSIDEANERLLQYIKINKYDLFMTPHNEEDLYIETLELIKNKGIPTLLICFDNLIIPFYHKYICKFFDLVWLTSKETENMFKKWGANTIFMPYAANPYMFYPKKQDEINRISFIGTPYGSRANRINLLIDNGINVTLHSNLRKQSNELSKVTNKQQLKDYIKPAYNLSRFSIGRRVILGAFKQKFTKQRVLNLENKNLEIKPVVPLELLGESYSKYSLSLASTEARNTGILKKPVNIVNLRSFEIPMSGGLQICSYFDELAQYFEEDKEILFYRTEEEFIEKAKYYLRPENEKIRNDIKLAARKRAENDHTWFCRFKKVFDYLGLDYK